MVLDLGFDLATKLFLLLSKLVSKLNKVGF